jgi:nucleotide-binding universal stress UspA family protein
VKHILVAHDLSARADRALDRAVILARQHATALSVLHVIDERMPDNADEETLAKKRRDLTAAVEALVPDDDLDVEIRIVFGQPFDEIRMAADETGCDLIVLGRHRQERCDERFAGTTIGRVLRGGICPVLVARDPAHEPYRRVVVGVDFSDFSRQALHAAIAIAPDTPIAAVHAYDVPFEGFLPGGSVRQEVLDGDTRELARLIDDVANGSSNSGPIEAVHRHGDVIGVLRKEVRQSPGTLLVVGTHGRSGIAAAIFGSVARDLLEQPPCDILTVSPAL